MDEFRIVAEGRRVKMMVVLGGCQVRKTRKGDHPERAKPVVCAELGKGNYGFREYRMCRRKVRYKCQSDAKKKIRDIRRVRPENELSVYYCPYCDGWHLTHR